MFFESRDFEFIAPLENNWLMVRTELEQLQPKNFIDWPEKNIYNQGCGEYCRRGSSCKGTNKQK